MCFRSAASSTKCSRGARHFREKRRLAKRPKEVQRVAESGKPRYRLTSEMTRRSDAHGRSSARQQSVAGGRVTGLIQS
jgi:hypothetical protein